MDGGSDGESWSSKDLFFVRRHELTEEKNGTELMFQSRIVEPNLTERTDAIRFVCPYHVIFPYEYSSSTRTQYSEYCTVPVQNTHTNNTHVIHTTQNNLKPGEEVFQ